jgi:predicted DCC family thiol-disulfide oxidoreductase YuxK
MHPEKPVIFFDGVCGLCNQFVTDVFLHDSAHQFLFAALQGAAAQQLIPYAPTETVVLWDRGTIFVKSEAALKILAKLGGVRGWLGRWGRFVPRGLADSVYDLVAAHRYRIFGRLDVCRLPTAAEKPYFLD